VTQSPDTSRHCCGTVADTVAICPPELKSVAPGPRIAILEDSTQLYKQLSTVAWFTLGREPAGSRQGAHGARRTDQKLKR